MNAQNHELAPEDLRWICDGSEFEFDTTDEFDHLTGFVGQDSARDALMFGLQCDAPGQNIYVRGARGTGRLRLVKKLLAELAPCSPDKKDRCYVHNFARADHPRLISLPPGTAKKFKKRIGDLAEFAGTGLIKALDSEPFVSRRSAIKESIEKETLAITKPLEKDLAENGLAMVSMQQGQMTATAIFPIVDGKPVPPEQLRSLVAEDKAPQEQLDKFEDDFPKFQKIIQSNGREIAEKYRNGAEAVNELNKSAARELVSDLTEPILSDFAGSSVVDFVNEIVEDVIENRLEKNDKQPDLKELYGVNIVLEHDARDCCPIVEENTPSLINLLGTVDPDWGPGGTAVSDYRGVRGGALLMADRGYLILNVSDVLSEPGAWRAMMRTLRTGRLEIVPPEAGWMRPYVVVQPEPIEIKVRVILIGDMSTYYQLDYHDPDFRELFKVLVDLDTQIDRDARGKNQYAAVVAAITKEESLPPFDKSAIGALIEQGARIASRANKLTAKLRRVADIAREAAFLATNEDQSPVLSHHVHEAVRRTKQRASLPSRKFAEMVQSGTLIIETSGDVVGQINGLAVIHSGPLTYGFPARITATIGAGRAGVINVEGRAQMSGSIHTKGFHILGGLLRYLMHTEHPLAFSASLAFEQSYGGIDGDSASGAEVICLLSALTGIPIKQSMAMTGAIDQHGHLQAIGGVNEKVEGFFDACQFFGLTGEQGVLIPKSNAADLMLRVDVVDACRQGKFHVFATDNIFDAIEIMTGVPAGEFVDGEYAAGTLLHTAVERAHEFWKRTMASPSRLTSVERNNGRDDKQLIIPEMPDRDE
ncbi:AAA family ATPase [Vicingaceae bacterium]|nr:AAA family ATPase [Vicingaceae bacterium]